MIASSSSSPPTRIDWLTTMPPRLMTATSEVPPPMSTTMLPVGSPTRSPAPRGAGARAQAGLLDRALLDPGDAARDADDDARVRPAVLVHLLDEVPEHLFR